MPADDDPPLRPAGDDSKLRANGSVLMELVSFEDAMAAMRGAEGKAIRLITCIWDSPVPTEASTGRCSPKLGPKLHWGKVVWRVWVDRVPDAGWLRMRASKQPLHTRPMFWADNAAMRRCLDNRTVSSCTHRYTFKVGYIGLYTCRMDTISEV